MGKPITVQLALAYVLAGWLLWEFIEEKGLRGEFEEWLKKKGYDKIVAHHLSE